MVAKCMKCDMIVGSRPCHPGVLLFHDLFICDPSFMGQNYKELLEEEIKADIRKIAFVQWSHQITQHFFLSQSWQETEPVSCAGQFLSTSSCDLAEMNYSVLHFRE